MEEFPHAAFRRADREGRFDPRDDFLGAAHGGIKPSHQLLLLRHGENRVVAPSLHGAERVDACAHKDMHPPRDRLGIAMEDAGHMIAIMTRIEQEDGLNPFADAALMRLLIPTLHVVPLAASERKQGLAHCYAPSARRSGEHTRNLRYSATRAMSTSLALGLKLSAPFPKPAEAGAMRLRRRAVHDRAGGFNHPRRTHASRRCSQKVSADVDIALIPQRRDGTFQFPSSIVPMDH